LIQAVEHLALHSGLVTASEGVINCLMLKSNIPGMDLTGHWSCCGHKEPRTDDQAEVKHTMQASTFYSFSSPVISVKKIACDLQGKLLVRLRQMDQTGTGNLTALPKTKLIRPNRRRGCSSEMVHPSQGQSRILQ
jgi:hypothetical protein